MTSIKPGGLLRLFIELTFVILGLLLIWLAFSSRAPMSQRSLLWIAVAGFLIYWGFRSWLSPTGRDPLWPQRVRGWSLILVGTAMLVLAWLGPHFEVPLLIACGVVMSLRGIINAALIARAQRSA